MVNVIQEMLNQKRSNGNVKRESLNKKRYMEDVKP